VIVEKVKLAMLIGEAQNKMWHAWSKVVPCVRASSMEEAVRVAASHAGHGDTVLLSPRAPVSTCLKTTNIAVTNSNGTSSTYNVGTKQSLPNSKLATSTA